MKYLKIIIVLSLLSLFGCQATQAPSPAPSVSNAFLKTQNIIIGTSRENRPIECNILGNGKNVILLMASIHGNEIAGTSILKEFNHLVHKKPHLIQNAQIILIPTMNPDGVAHNTRYNAQKIDLNRNFPASNRQNNQRNGLNPLTEPESQALYKVINDYQPDLIIAFHEPLNCIDYDGPAQNIAEQMAKYCTLPVKKLGARPGSLGAYTGEELNIPTITMELPKGAGKLDSKRLWQRYGNAVLAAINVTIEAKEE